MAVSRVHPGTDKRIPVPMYYQIMEEIRNKIYAGEYAVGAALPSERELSDMYQVSRNTLRQAIMELANEGILVRRQGIGTFVAPPKLEHVLNRLTSFSEDMDQRNMHAGGQTISFEEREPTLVEASTLHLSGQDRVIECVRLRSADDVPMALETTVLAAALCPGLRVEDLGNHSSLYALLAERWNVRMDRASQSVEPTLATPYEAELLDVQPETPMLLMRRVAWDQLGRPVEYTKSIYRGDRYKFVIELRQHPA